MSRVVVVGVGTTGNVDSADSLSTTIGTVWPNADFKVLVSSRIVPSNHEWESVRVERIHGTPFPIPQILSEEDQVALGLPIFLSRLLDEYDVCVFVGPDLLVGR